MTNGYMASEGRGVPDRKFQPSPSHNAQPRKDACSIPAFTKLFSLQKFGAFLTHFKLGWSTIMNVNPIEYLDADAIQFIVPEEDAATAQEASIETLVCIESFGFLRRNSHVNLMYHLYRAMF